MMKRIIIHLTVVFMFLSPVISNAQALPFTAVDYDAVTLAKGGVSLTETSTVANAAFANPAAIVFYDDMLDASLAYTMWQPDFSNTSVASAGAALKIGKNIGVALGFSKGSCPEYETVDGSGAETGSFKPGNLQLGLGVAYKIIPFLSVGANIGYAVENLAPEMSYGALNADVYAMLKLGSLKAAVGVSELGGKVTSQSGASFSLPTSANVGIGYDLELSDTHAVNLNADAAYYLMGDIAAAAGVSYTYSKMVTARAGYRYGGSSVIPSFASAGIGIRLFGAKLDFAYLFASDVMKNTMSISIGYSF
ncbi:MAG: PorV/PorQ family protein [Bacteroidales bacterium]|nr:PorV/PorQ family protein [Bacteroidales bacterium]